MADDDSNQVQKIDLDKVDWKSSREFFESLGEELDKLDNKDEAYDFTWVGKRKAVIEAGAPINKTLRPNVEESKDWDTTENLFIEGDNLDALKLLQESYLGKVKMIYIDPPYNTGGDFVYHDDFRASVEDYDEDTEYKDASGNIQFKKNDKSNGRYHSDWLSMMYPRLKLARNLLSEDGVIFISIDDNEQANLRRMLDELFGEENFIGQIVRNTNSSKNQSLFISVSHEYCLVYARNIEPLSKKHAEDKWSVPKNNIDEYKKRVSKLKQQGLSNDEITDELKILTNYPRFIDFTNYWYFDDRGLYRKDNLGGVSNGNTEPLHNPLTNKDDPIPPGGYRYNSEKLSQLVKDDRIHFHTDGSLPTIKRYLDENSSQRPKSIMSDDQRPDYSMLKSMGLEFDNPKQLAFMSRIISIVDNDSIVLDFFSGSGTTAHAVMQLNAEDGGSRKHIQIQLSEETDEKSEARKAGYKTIPEIARERIRRAGEKIQVDYKDKLIKRVKPLDVGFRTLTVADTNYKEVYKSVSQHTQESLLDTVDNVKEDRSDLDLLYGVLVQSALELNRPIEKKKLSGADVYVYDYFGEVSGLVACFADSVPEDTIKEIAKLKPLTAVFKDSSFESSQDKVNLAEHFRIISPDTKVKVV